MFIPNYIILLENTLTSELTSYSPSAFSPSLSSLIGDEHAVVVLNISSTNSGDRNFGIFPFCRMLKAGIR